MKTVVSIIRRQFNVMKAVAFVTYKEWAAYRSHMLVSILVGPLNFIIQYFIWHAVYSHNPVINGITLDQMITYFGIVTIVYYLTMDFADWNLQMLIHTGQFVTYIIRPMSHRFFALSQKVGHRILGFIFEFLPVTLILVFAFRISLVPAEWGWAICSVLLGFLMNFLINYSIGITGFWLIRAEGVRRMIHIVYAVLRGSLIPLVFFPVMIQKILFFLPFQFATYVPIRVILGTYELGGYSFSLPVIVGIQVLAVTAMYLVSQFLWVLGIRKFTGVGV